MSNDNYIFGSQTFNEWLSKSPYHTGNISGMYFKKKEIIAIRVGQTVFMNDGKDKIFSTTKDASDFMFSLNKEKYRE